MRQGSVGLDAQASGSLASSLLSHVHRVPLVSVHASCTYHLKQTVDAVPSRGLGSDDAFLPCVMSHPLWDMQAL